MNLWVEHTMSRTAANQVGKLFVLFAISIGQGAKSNGKGIAVIPEIFPCVVDVSANIGSSAKRQSLLCERNKTGMPETQNNSRSKSGLPIRLRSDNLMHQPEEPAGVVLDLDVHVKLNMLILRLQKFRFESSSNDDSEGRRNVRNT